MSYDDHGTQDHDGGIAWGMVALVLVGALTLLFLGVGIGTWYGDTRGFARGHARGVQIGEELERAVGLERQRLLHDQLRGCVSELLEVREGIERVAKLSCPPGTSPAEALAGGWELGYRQAREDWESPCLPSH